MITIVGAKIRREVVNRALICVGVPIRNEELSLGGSPESDGILFSEVTDCEIHLLSKRVDFCQTTIRNCRFVARGVIADLRWNGVLYSHCRFEGIYKLLSLGMASGAIFAEQHEFGVIACDFGVIVHRGQAAADDGAVVREFYGEIRLGKQRAGECQRE